MHNILKPNRSEVQPLVFGEKQCTYVTSCVINRHIIHINVRIWPKQIQQTVNKLANETNHSM